MDNMDQSPLSSLAVALTSHRSPLPPPVHEFLLRHFLELLSFRLRHCMDKDLGRVLNLGRVPPTSCPYEGLIDHRLPGLDSLGLKEGSVPRTLYTTVYLTYLIREVIYEYRR